MSISNLGNKIFSYYNDAKKLIKSQMVVPRFISIWLTTTCQYKCSYCYFNEENKEKKFANTAKVKKFIDDISSIGVESLEFSGGGEPTLHPDFYEIAQYAYDKGLKVGLLSNGYKLQYSKMSFFSYIRIGLDAATSEVYTQLKGTTPELFDIVLAKVSKFIKDRDKQERPRIGLKFMINKTNSEYLRDMLKLALTSKVDYCHFKRTHNDKDSISEYRASRANKWLSEMKEMYPNFIYGGFSSELPTVKCFMSPIHTVVTPDGNALVCCYFTDENRTIGNVFDNDFLDVWNCERHQNIIDTISIKECQSVQCRWHKYNTEMYEVLKNQKYDLSFI